MPKKPKVMPLGNPLAFPAGSPQGRAAARAMVEAMKPPAPTPDEADCLLICRSDAFFPGIENSQAFSRGRELWETRNPGRPFYDGPEEVAARASEYGGTQLKLARLAFHLLYGRYPEAGDVFSFEPFQTAMIAMREDSMKRFEDAWRRQMPGQPLPKRSTIDSHRYSWEQLEHLATGKKSCGTQAEYDNWKPLTLVFTETGITTQQPN